MSTDARLGGRIAIVGAGAIGLYYGARLAANGEDVHFLLRSDFDAVREKGIRVESVDGDLQLPDVSAYRSAEEIGPVDWIIVSWKATSNHRYGEVLGPLVGEGTQILTLQNGLGNCEALNALFGPERVLGGLCFVCINRIASGHVRHTAGGKITVGEWQAEDGVPRARSVASALESAGVVSQAAENLSKVQWRKLVWNVPFNGLAIAEGGVTTDILLADPEVERTVGELMREVISVATAKGLEIEESVVEFEIARTRPMGAYRPSSMIDFVEGRAVEYEAIWGEPLRQAKAVGIEVPQMERLAARIRERLAL